MAVPKRRTSRAKRNQRRANHDKVSAPALVRVEHEGQELIVPRRIVRSLAYLTPKELRKLGAVE